VHDGDFETRGELWAPGYVQEIALHEHAWEPLRSEHRMAEVLLLSLLALLPDPAGEDGIKLSYERRSRLIRALPMIAGPPRPIGPGTGTRCLPFR
jgi:hypothetical protein